ncbi:MAG: exopolysaccharide biosynthesis protein [Verrucomicrobia bacterium]|nr:exopolysaccharide biosynthesis protein [Verrucomicrobiota bacterium]
MHHTPLSKDLEAVVRAEVPPGGLTLNDLIRRTEGRGVYLLIVLLCLPFVQPIPLPGFSTVLGVVIIFLAYRLVFPEPRGLPRFIGDRVLPPGFQIRVVNGSIRFLRWVEKVVRPRRTVWLQTRPARAFNALLIVVLAALLALPIPIPFTNQPPGFSILLLALAMMEEDGVLVWFAYALALVTAAWFTMLAFFGEKAIVMVFEFLKRAGHSAN